MFRGTNLASNLVLTNHVEEPTWPELIYVSCRVNVGIINLIGWFSHEKLFTSFVLGNSNKRVDPYEVGNISCAESFLSTKTGAFSPCVFLLTHPEPGRLCQAALDG